MDSKISALNSATVLTDADVLPIVNGAETKKVTVALLKNGLVKVVVKDANASTAVTGVITEQPIGTYLIPANTFGANDVMRISSFLTEKTGTVGTVTMRVKVGTNVSGAGATTIAMYTTTASEVFSIMSRQGITLRGGNLKFLSTSNSRQTDASSSSNSIATTSFNPAVDNYIFTSLQLSLGTESAFQSNFLVTN